MPILFRDRHGVSSHTSGREPGASDTSLSDSLILRYRATRHANSSNEMAFVIDGEPATESNKSAVRLLDLCCMLALKVKETCNSQRSLLHDHPVHRDLMSGSTYLAKLAQAEPSLQTRQKSSH